MYSDTNDPGPYNLGNPEEFSILELAETIIRLTDSKSKIIFLEKPTDDPRCRRPDIAKARRNLHWKPVTTLEQGLKKTIAHFDNLLSAEQAPTFSDAQIQHDIEAELEA